jgi:hypothetical protein
MRCALCGASTKRPFQYGQEHWRPNYGHGKEFDGRMTWEHVKWVLKMRPLRAPEVEEESVTTWVSTSIMRARQHRRGRQGSSVQPDVVDASRSRSSFYRSAPRAKALAARASIRLPTSAPGAGSEP